MMRIVYSFIFIIFSCAYIVKAQEKNTSDSLVHTFVAVDAFHQPPNGIDKFKIHWVNYLDSLHQIGVLKNEKLYSDHVFNVIISINGSLVQTNNLPQDSILRDFLKIQKRWQLGLQSGRPVSSLLKMKIPKEIFQRWEKRKLVLIPDLIVREEFPKGK